MANKSRRLPGGKVRKPAARGPQPAARGPRPRPTQGQQGPVAGQPDAGGPPADLAPVAARGAAGSRATLPGEPPLAPNVTARRIIRPAARPATVVGDVAVQGRGAARAPAQRGGRSLMDLAAANYTHIRGDLVRIAVLAMVMLAIIVALSFVLPAVVR